MKSYDRLMAVLEAQVGRFVAGRRLESALLVGGILMAIVLAVVSYCANGWFIYARERADDVRWNAAAAEIAFFKLREAANVFLVRGFTEPGFHERGESPLLEERQRQAQEVQERLRTLDEMAGRSMRPLLAELRAAADADGALFEQVVAAVRERGFHEWGLEGEWRRAIRGLEGELLAARNQGAQIALLQLRRNEKDYLLRGDERYVAAVHADLDRLTEYVTVSGGPAATAMAAQLAAYRAHFDRYVAVQKRIGAGSADGLLARLEQQAQATQAQFDRLIEHAVADSDRARLAMALSMALGALIAVGLATVVLRVFARTLVAPIRRVGEAAVQVGAGNLDARVPVDSRNELGDLAASFNGMAEALATLVGQVQKSGIQVASSVNEIAATAKEQQATASEIAATTLEIGATAREISVTSRELVNSVREVSEVAAESATLAGTGQSGLSRMEQTMRSVVEAAGAISEKLHVLNEQAANINQVITTITKVADQTNLLSLNAAIEAEKAGEYGRGFSVVATEIRRLADQTAVATYDIEQIVKQIRAAVADSVMGMGRFSEEVRRGTREVQTVGGQLSQIIHQVQALAPRFEAVHEGMQAQATGADQITQALEQLTEAAQQTVESLRQGTQAIDGLNDVSGGLHSSVSRFRLGR